MTSIFREGHGGGIATLAIALMSTPAVGQDLDCYMREPLIAAFAQTEGLSRHSVAQDQYGNLVEIWVNLDTGRWVYTITPAENPNLLCPALNGAAFELVNDAIEPTGIAL